MVDEKLRVISTFSGCGGSSLGYKMAGFNELLAIDFDQNSVETFRLNFPEITCWQEDIKNVSGNTILSHFNLKKGELEVLDGSPPCQGFSTAGKRNVIDPRNDLFKEYVRLIKELEPKVFVMENVSGQVKGVMKGKFKEIITILKSLNYNVKCKLLNSANYEVPQRRQRLFYIGVRKDLNKEFDFPKPSKKIITVKEAFKDLPEQTEERIMPEWLKKAYYEIKPLSGSKKTSKIFIKYKGTSGGSISTIKISLNKPSPTITKSEISISGLMHPTKPRYLTTMELKRLSSFPDDFKFTNRTEACKRIGNSVMPLQMKAIAEQIKKVLT